MRFRPATKTKGPTTLVSMHFERRHVFLIPISLDRDGQRTLANAMFANK